MKTMTKEQKIEWLAKATNEKLVDQFRNTVRRMNCVDFKMEMDACDDYTLVENELMRRLNKVMPE